MKRFLFAVAAFLIGFVIFFAIGEVMFRIFRGPMNPLEQMTQAGRGYLRKPLETKSAVVSGNDGISYTWHINRFGYRGKDFSMPKEPGALRIFVIGDSFAFGIGVKDDETIPALIEQKLRAKGYRNVEVVNAGISGSSTISHYVNLRDIHLRYGPDMVLLLFDFTDMVDDWRMERKIVYDRKGNIHYFDDSMVDGKRDWWLYLVSRSAFCRWINNKIVRAVRKASQLGGWKHYLEIAKEGKKAKGEIASAAGQKDEEIIIENDPLLMLRGGERRELIDAQWPRCEKYLFMIKGLLEEHGVPFVVGMYPSAIFVDAHQWGSGRKAWKFEEKVYTDYYPFQLMEGFAKKAGVPFLNTLRDFLKSPKGKKYFFDYDGHLTPAGNERVATAIVNDPRFIRVVEEGVEKRIENKGREEDRVGIR